MSPLSRPFTVNAVLVQWLPLLAFCAVVANHLWFVYCSAINIPHQDGIYDFLHFLQRAQAAAGVQEFFAEVFQQYMFHRTSSSRLFVFAAYLLEGEINFRTLTIVANYALVFILLLFYLSVRNEDCRWVWLLVAALLLLNLRFYTIILWSQPAFPYYLVFFFAFSTLFALHNVTIPKLLLAALLCTLSSFSYAAGQLAWLLGLASLLHQCFLVGRKSLLLPALWLLLAAVMLVVWRIDYVSAAFISDQPYLGLNIDLMAFPSQVYDASLDAVILRYIAFFLVTLGSAFTDTSVWIAGVVGFIVLAILSFVSIKVCQQKDIRLALCCWFVVASAAAVAMGRATWLAPDYALTTRYSFLSVLLVTTLSLLLQTKFKLFKTPIAAVVVGMAAAYWIWANHHFDAPLQDMMSARYQAFNSQHYPVFGIPDADAKAVVMEAIATGLYQPPCRPLPACEVIYKSAVLQ